MKNLEDPQFQESFATRPYFFLASVPVVTSLGCNVFRQVDVYRKGHLEELPWQVEDLVLYDFSDSLFS